MRMTGAALNRGGSRQDWGTPPEFLNAFRAEFGPIGFDLAAHAGNAVHERYFTDVSDEPQDSLAQDWTALDVAPSEWLWLNPPYSNIAPWAEKCWQYANSGLVLPKLAMLIPASVGSNYWARFIHGTSGICLLNGRIKFVGAKDPYPKDLALCIYGPTGVRSGYRIWRWRDSIHREAA